MTTRKLTVDVGVDASKVAAGFKDAADEAEGFGDNLLGILGGSKLKLGLASAGTALGAVAVEGFLTGMGNEASADKVAATMMPSDADFATMGSVAGDLYRDAYGESLAEMQGIVAELINADVADIDLKPLGAQVADIGTAFDQDFNEVIRTGRNLVNNGLVPDMGTAFDVITRGMQSTGATGREELLEVLNEYSDAFQSLGIDGPTAIGLLSNAIDDGAFNMDKVGDALKEFSIRVIDGSDGSREALQMLGLDAEETMATIAAGGPAAQEAMSEIIAALNGMGDAVEQEKAGVALFGSTWEDLGHDVVLGLDPAKAAIGDISTATEDMGRTLNDNLQTDIEGFKRKAMQGISDGVYNTALPAINALIDAFNDDGLAGVVELVGDSFKKAFDDLLTWLKDDGAEQIAKFFLVTMPIELGKAIVEWHKIGLDLGWTAITGIKNGAEAAWAATLGWFQRMPNMVVAKVSWLATWFEGLGQRVIRGMKDGAVALWGGLESWIGGVPGKLMAPFNGLYDSFKRFGKSIIQGLIDGLKELWDKLVGWFNKIVNLINKIPGINVGGMASAGTVGFNGAPPTSAGGITIDMGGFPTGGGGHPLGGISHGGTKSVPGIRGQNRWMLLEAGERITSAGQVAREEHQASMGGGFSMGHGGTTIVVHNHLHGPATIHDGRRVVESLIEYVQTRGPIPVPVKGSL